MYKVYFMTFGCKVNQYETECLRSAFCELGFQESSSPEEASVIVVNSCTVTASGDSKSLHALRRLRRLAPEAVTVLTGCMPQADPEAARNIPEADIITGTKDRSRIPELALEVLRERRRIVEIGQHLPREDFECADYKSSFGQTRAFMKIQDGCNSFCSYCIIPYARGRCRSKPMAEISREAEMLARAGHKEIVLVGIDLASYGAEWGLRLADAVEEVCKTEGIERVRLGSLEPELLLSGDLQRLAAQKKLCPQFHLSLQSGCGRTLKAMRRRYTPEEFLAVTEEIRRLFPDCALTTDIMVGFPGETEEDFQESLEFARRIAFSKLHVFQYSPRKGTPAAAMEQVPERVKSDRALRMKALGDELAAAHLRSLVGKTLPVLFEKEDSPRFHRGCAPDHSVIKILRKNVKKSLRNQIISVIIEESFPDHCLGRIAGT
ncbi:MAG: tRNA (N(6)-L-threonylcarbamoyladenosine(37)-C(2))-methylthiotransferase MtaB [Ruminococcus sp.]|nr:tRNA (N(6)-L-threonylcarbamoyladenosine(37)-C(2))-methylthiotransferase MtaB [Ruminococcus sp.]